MRSLHNRKKMEQILYLIRHGAAVGAETGLLYGETDLPISEAGLEEIRTFADEGIYPDAKEAILFTSGMLRTEQTFKEIYGDKDHIKIPELREYNLGKYEMMTAKEAEADEYCRSWLRGELCFHDFEGGDNDDSFADRVEAGYRKMLKISQESAAEKIIAIVHGQVITFLLDQLFPGEFPDRWEWTPMNGLGFEVKISNGTATSWTHMKNGEIESLQNVWF